MATSTTTRGVDLNLNYATSIGLGTASVQRNVAPDEMGGSQVIGGVIGLVIVIAVIVAALYFKPIRKTIGLLFVILGGLASMTGIGLIIGVPLILMGGLLLFI